jgi:hypothetical protein
MSMPTAAIWAWMYSPKGTRAWVVLKVKLGSPPEALYSAISCFARSGSYFGHAWDAASVWYGLSSANRLVDETSLPLYWLAASAFRSSELTSASRILRSLNGALLKLK